MKSLSQFIFEVYRPKNKVVGKPKPGEVEGAKKVVRDFIKNTKKSEEDSFRKRGQTNERPTKPSDTIKDRGSAQSRNARFQSRKDGINANAGTGSTPKELKRSKGFLDRVFKNLEKGSDNLTKRLTGRFSRPATRKGQRPQEVRGRSGKPFSGVKKDIDAKNPTRTSSVTGGKLPAGDGRKNNKQGKLKLEGGKSSKVPSGPPPSGDKVNRGPGRPVGSKNKSKGPKVKQGELDFSSKGEWKTGANPSGKPEVSKPKAVKQSEVSKKATEYTKKYTRAQKSALTGKANKIIDDLRGKSPSAKLSARMKNAVDSSTKPGTYSDKVNQALKYKKPTPPPKSTVITSKSTGRAPVSSTGIKPLLDPVKWQSNTSAEIKTQAAKASKAREIKLSQPSDFKPKTKPTSTSIPKTKTSAFTKGLGKSKAITPEVVTKTPFDKVANTSTKNIVKGAGKSIGKQTFKQFAKKAISGVGRVANPIATAAFTVDDLATGYKSERAKGASTGRSVAKGVTKAGSYLGGAAAGGKLGAAIGTAILPGFGTAAGALIGGVAGGLTASSVANKTFDKVAGKTALQKQMEKNKVKRKKLTGTSTKSAGVPGGYWKGMNPGLRGGGVNISAN